MAIGGLACLQLRKGPRGQLPFRSESIQTPSDCEQSDGAILSPLRAELRKALANILHPAIVILSEFELP